MLLRVEVGPVLREGLRWAWLAEGLRWGPSLGAGARAQAWQRQVLVPAPLPVCCLCLPPRQSHAPAPPSPTTRPPLPPPFMQLGPRDLKHRTCVIAQRGQPGGSGKLQGISTDPDALADTVGLLGALPGLKRASVGASAVLPACVRVGCAALHARA